jgi:hypothetical protein
MRQRLTFWMLVILLTAIALPEYSTVWGSEKPKAIPISKTDVFAPFIPENEKSSTACIIQNDDGTPVSVGVNFDSGMGVAAYIDPAKCSAQRIYPFKITNVHFFLYHESTNWIWPLKIEVRIKNAILADKCLGPDTLNTLYSQSFTIPVDSSYSNLAGRPMNLTLSPPYCVYQPFFLEIDYLTPLVLNDTLPGLLLDDSVAPADTCVNWGMDGGSYFKWSIFWAPPAPGDAIIQASGFTNAPECDTGWYWKADRINAPSGMPDFDQNQNSWVSYCGPVSAANCLWWYGAVPVGWTPPQLADTLARYFHTTPALGTFVDSMQLGLEEYFI